MSQESYSAVEAHLALIRGDATLGFFEVRALPSRRQWFVGLTNLRVAADTILDHASQEDVYVGVAPRCRKSGTVADVAQVWCLWVDIDHEDDLGYLDTFQPRPAAIVKSGSGGAHAYWPLAEPLTPVHAQRANRRLALELHGDMKATDAARVLRPPHTFNHKHDPPVEVSWRYRPLRAHYVAREVVGGLEDSIHYQPRPEPPESARNDEDVLIRTVVESQPGDRNGRFFWAACRAIERGQPLGPLEQAGKDIGLTDTEIAASVRSAHRNAGG